MISFLQMSLWSAALTALILFARAVFGRRLPKLTFNILWAIVILRMLVPLSLPIMKINTGVAVPSPAVQDTIIYTYIEGEFSPNAVADEILPDTVYEVTETADTSLSVYKIWLLTATAVFAAFAAVHLKFRLKVRDAIPAEIDFEAGLKRRVRIKVSDKIDSPLTYGIFRPVILLPKNIYKCDEKAASYILSHELTHIKRFDVLYKLFMVLAVSLHWFNPFAWIMLVLASRDIELSCDEEVILGNGGSREEYALTLIEMEEKRSFCVLLNGFGGSSVKERIKAVMKLKKASPFGRAAAVLLVALAFMVFTVYDIDNEFFLSVTISASDFGETYYTDDQTAVEWTHYEYTLEAVADAEYAMEEITCTANSAEAFVVDHAPYSADAYDSSDKTAYSETVSITEDTAIIKAVEWYSFYNYGFEDPDTGEFVIVTIDLNEYSPIDCEKYGLTISPDKGYYMYDGIPVAGLQCNEHTLIDNIAIKDGGSFYIYDNYNGMVQVNTAQFFKITGMH